MPPPAPHTSRHVDSTTRQMGKLLPERTQTTSRINVVCVCTLFVTKSLMCFRLAGTLDHIHHVDTTKSGELAIT
jgi:hypothetical protein